MNDSHLTSMRATSLALALFVGCTGSTETTVETEATPSSQTETDISEAETQSGKPETEATIDSLPNDLPDDIYIADGRQATQSTEIGGKENLILDYPASDIDDFIKSYLDGMSAQGWTLVTSSELPIGTITNFSKNDRKCTISIAPPKDGVIKVSILLPSE